MSTEQDPAQDPITEAEATPPPGGGDDAAEVVRLRAELQKARKWEDRAKANAAAARELEQLRQQHESDQERAIREAVDAARTEERSRLSADRVADAFRAAAAGRDVDVDELVSGINPARFLSDDGNPDRDAVQEWIDKVAPARESSPLDLAQGARHSGTNVPGLNSSQLERDLRAKLGIS